VVYVHIGEPKTGTTFLQDVLWANRPVLAARGIMLPGYNRRDHSRASRDLRQTPRETSDVADPWTGEWDVLIGQALCAPGVAVISDELLSACTPDQADRAVRSLAAAEVHVILTARDVGACLPAEWQETVKCRGTDGWRPWLDAVVAATAAPDRRDRSWFWSVHDTLELLALWSRHIPAHRVHVISTPRQPSPELLWARFASVLGVEPAGIDLNQARANSSLGYAETEFLRRVNELLPADVPDWFYTRTVKRILAYGVLGSVPAGRRTAVPPELQHWVKEQSDLLIAGLRESDFDLVGDLSELLHVRAADRLAAAAGQPAEVVDVAAASAAALAGELYHRMYPERPPRRSQGGPRRSLSQFEWRLLHGPLVQRRLRRASHRRSVQHLRVAIWRVLMRPGRRRAAVPEHADRQALQPGVVGVSRASNAA